MTDAVIPNPVAPEDPIVDALGIVAEKLTEVNLNLVQLDNSFHLRTEKFQGVLRGMMGVMAVVLLSLYIILSAVWSDMPGLRLANKGRAQTSEAIRQLQCTVLWSNGYRVEFCRDINGFLTQVTGRE